VFFHKSIEYSEKNAIFSEGSLWYKNYGAGVSPAPINKPTANWTAINVKRPTCMHVMYFFYLFYLKLQDTRNSSSLKQ